MNRKSFLKRMGLGFLGAAFSPVVAKAVSETDPDYLEFMEQKKNIRNIKRMGFQWETADPFLFCVHHEDFFPKGKEDMSPDVSLSGRHLGDDFIIKDGFRMYHGKTIPGFPGHPHRGFETVTVVRKGLVDHADSLGAAGRYGNGDVQWMTAGKGVQHSEMFPLLHSDKENPMELFQIWLNLPKKDKMVEPHFKMFWKENIPVADIKDKNGKVTKIEVIAGSLDKYSALTPPPNSWAAKNENHVAIWVIHMEAGARFTMPAIVAGINRTIYFYEGKNLVVGDTHLEYYHSAQLESSENIEIVNGDQPASLLMLQGRPIAEQVIQYGPFVMNTKEEIHQAFEDYHKTQFGGWPWPRYDQVHPKTQGRFAKHADGKLETKND